MTAAARAWAILLVRVALGVPFFFFGIEKFFDFSGYAQGMIKGFENTWLPDLLLYPFTYLFPFAEVIGGAFLFLGLFTAETLAVMGSTAILLMFGQVLLHEPVTVAHNGFYVLLAAVGLLLVEHNRYSLDALRKPKS